jgi:ADP-ribose pyrophosphatase YjhB (NUDIX family)
MNTFEPKQHSHCSYCGTRFTEQKLWPRKCFRCYNDSFSNPLPVVVVMLVVQDGFKKGLLIQRRGIDPEKGKWALTGGYIDDGETWQEAAVREVKEELDLKINPAYLALEGVTSSTKKNNMLIMCSYQNFWDWKGYDDPGLRDYFQRSTFIPNHEVEAIDVMWEPMDLAFPAHTEYANKLLASLNASDKGAAPLPK